MSSGYVWLLSDAQLSYFPDNNGSHFSNRISPPLAGDHVECALLSLDFEYNFDAKTSAKHRFSYKIVRDGKAQTRNVVITKEASTMEVLNKTLNKDGWSLVTNGSQYKLEKVKEDAPVIILSRKFSSRFHLPSRKTDKGLASRPHTDKSIYIVSSIATPQYFGDHRRPILGSIPRNGLLGKFTFINPSYVDVVVNPIAEIGISFVDRQGNLIPFPAEVNVTAFIHFRTKT